MEACPERAPQVRNFQCAQDMETRRLAEQLPIMWQSFWACWDPQLQICGSADLLCEPGAEPWLAQFKPEAALWKGLQNSALAPRAKLTLQWSLMAEREVRRLNDTWFILMCSLLSSLHLV